MKFWPEDNTFSFPLHTSAIQSKRSLNLSLLQSHKPILSAITCHHCRHRLSYQKEMVKVKCAHWGYEAISKEDFTSKFTSTLPIVHFLPCMWQLLLYIFMQQSTCHQVHSRVGLFRFAFLQRTYVDLHDCRGLIKLRCSADRVTLMNDVDIMFRNSQLLLKTNKVKLNC